HILGINTLLVTLPSNLPALNELKSNKANMDSLNTTAIYEQEFKEFLESTWRSLQTLQENSLFLQNLVESKTPSLQELYNKSNQQTLLTHLLGLVTSNSFKEALDLVDIIHKNTNPHRCIISDTNVLSLEWETKQHRKQSYQAKLS
ncbi:11771_t:CDS:1, partial [Racocetra persica]